MGYYLIYLSAKQLLIESNNDDEHFDENIGNEIAFNFVVAASAFGLSKTIKNKACLNKI